MREVLAGLLALLLVCPAMKAAPVDAVAIREQVLRFSRGTDVEIRFANKGKVRGRIGAVDDTGFAVGTTRIGFGEVESIRRRPKSMRNGLLVAGIVAGGVLLLATIAFARRSSPYK